MTKEFIDFVKQHQADDTSRLLLNGSSRDGIDLAAAAVQIEGLQTAREKWPSLLACDNFRYPPRLNREQSSSETAARYKAALVDGCRQVADLTGGMGIDTYFMSLRCQHVAYVEQDDDLCSLARENFAALGAANIVCHADDSMAWIGRQEDPFDLIYIDPARRGAHGQRCYAFEDCQPDIVKHLSLLCAHGQSLLVKASPMIDIDQAIRQLGHRVTAVHVVQVGGECKEVLFLVASDGMATVDDPVIHCVAADSGMHDRFSRAAEQALSWPLPPRQLPQYLYDPAAAWMKSGCYRSIAQRYGVTPLDRNTHLFGSDNPVESFPGRTFRLLQEVKVNRKTVATCLPEGKAHVITRNYPVAAAELQRQLSLREGGDRFLIATTVAGHRCGLICERI